MRKNLRCASLLLGTFMVANLIQSQSDRFAYAVTDVKKDGANWNFLRKLDLQTGTFSDVLLSGNDATLLAYDAETKKQFTTPLQDARFGNVVNAAFGTGVAAIALDQKHNRLYYTPMFIGIVLEVIRLAVPTFVVRVCKCPRCNIGRKKRCCLPVVPRVEFSRTRYHQRQPCRKER